MDLQQKTVGHIELRTLAIAALASFDTLQLFGRQSLIIFVTMDVGKFKSSGFSAILGDTLVNLI